MGPPGKMNKHFPFKFQVLHSNFQHQLNLTDVLKVLYRFDMYGSQQGLVLVCHYIKMFVVLFSGDKGFVYFIILRKHVADFSSS